MLAPFAAILLEDETLKTIQKDGDITTALDRVRKWREQRRPEVEALIERLDTLMADIQQQNPVADFLSSWLKFLSTKIDDAEAISHLLQFKVGDLGIPDTIGKFKWSFNLCCSLALVSR